MAKQTSNSDPEFEAMHGVYQALAALDHDAQTRVLRYVVARLQLASPILGEGPGTRAIGETLVEKEEFRTTQHSSFADLAAAASPNTNSERALVAGYWIQICGGSDSFDAYSAHQELKNLGLGVKNITVALDSLRTQNPSLVLQLKKSGRSQQARKSYKLTIPGVKTVESMISSANVS